MFDVGLEVCGDAFESADGNWLFLNSAASAGRLTRTITGSAQDARKNIGMPVDHVGIAVAFFSDQPDVLGNWGVGRAGPLAVHHFVEIFRIVDVGGFHILVARLQRIIHGSTTNDLFSRTVSSIGKYWFKESSL